MEFKGTKGLKILLSNEIGFGLGVDNDNVKLSIWGNDEEAKANALLISKAPEMLEMLNDILEAQDSGETFHSYKIEQLIKEATKLK